MNKPVAYINEEDGLVCAKCFKPFTKELTDEEIADATKAWFNIHPDAEWRERFEIKLYDLENFAKAILRKAQEK